MSLARFVCQHCPWSGDELHNDTCPNCGANRVVNQLESRGYSRATLEEMTPSQRFQLHTQWAATLVHYADTIAVMAQAMATMTQEMETDPDCDPNVSSIIKRVWGLGEWANDLSQQVREVSTNPPLRFMYVAPPVTPETGKDTDEFPF